MPRKFYQSSSKLLTIAGILIIIYAAFALSRTLWQNYKMNRDITSLKKEIESLEKRRQELTNLIAYYKTESYKEKEARRRMGYQKPGEHVLIVVPANNPQKEEEAEVIEKPNWQIWWEFFFK